MNIYCVEGFETSPYNPGEEIEASLISSAIVQYVVSSSVDMAEKRTLEPLHQEITCVEEQQKYEEKENTIDDQGM